MTPSNAVTTIGIPPAEEAGTLTSWPAVSKNPGIPTIAVPTDSGSIVNCDT